MDISSKTYLRQRKAPRRKEATRDEGQGLSPTSFLVGRTPSWLGGGPGVPTVKYYIILDFLF